MSKAQMKFWLAIFLSGFANATFAVGLANYVAIGLGNTLAEVNGSAGQNASSSAGYRIVAGSQVYPMFGVEAEYVDLGQFANSNSNIAARGLGISGVLTLPVTSMFSIYGRAGYARMETSVTPFPGSVVTTPLSDSLADLTLGYGIQIDIAPNASIRWAWERYPSSQLAGSFTNIIYMNSSGLLIFRF